MDLDDDELRRSMQALLDAARAAHPQIAVGDQLFVEAIVRRLSARSPSELSKIRATDVFVVAGALAKDRAAIGHLEGILETEMRSAASSVRAPNSVADEAKQRLAEHLFVGTGERGPAIADYAGLGDIRGFIRISAVRECLRLMRDSKREIGVDPDDLVRDAASTDPALERLKASYRDHFKVAFGEALARITPRERTLLRQQAIDRLSIDQIGAIYGVHRATAARWLERARARVAELTEQLIAERLTLESVEVESVIRLVQSQVDVSLERLLKGDE